MTINRWQTGDNNASLKTQLVAYFATDTRRNQWTRELQNIKQKDGEMIKDYFRRFKKLLNRAMGGQALDDRYKVNYYISGLQPVLY